MDLFRKNSAMMVVVFSTALVAVGNLNTAKEKDSFLLSYFKKEFTTEEKIQQRIKNNNQQQGLASVPLLVNSAMPEDDDIRSLMLKDGNTAQNQMQYQVLTASTPPDAKELLSQGADVAVYTVKDGDTLSSIAKDFNITTKTILWANDIENENMIQPGDQIFILPVTGVKHAVKSGDNIDSIAKKYSADKEKIIAFNELPASGEIKEGMDLVIPDGQIQETLRTTPSDLLPRRDYYSPPTAINESNVNRAPSIIDKNPKGGHKFPYGYCTWYVAQRKYVPWGGNAGTWLYHARAYGASTGKTPKAGAIVVTSESWYGHVGIVEKVSGGKITISEMNYRGWAKKSTRTISASSRVIKGYIY